MIKRVLFWSLICLSFCSCGPSFHSFYAEPEQVDYEIDHQLYDSQTLDQMDVSCAFVGDAINYVIFQVDVMHSLDTFVEFSAHQIRMVDMRTGLVINAISRDEQLDILEYEQKDLKREKRNRTINDVAWVGLNVLAGILGGGGSAATVNTLAFSVESSFYILETRRDFDIVNGSIEDEMKYVDEWTLGNDRIYPNENYTVDVLFPREMDLNSVEIQIYLADVELGFPFIISKRKLE